MKKKIYCFNLIEIVLTVAVISFGVAVILGMLPKGLRAARNTATVSYVSEVMEQMGYYLQRASSATLPNSMPSLSNNQENTIQDNYVRLIGGATGDFAATGMNGIFRFTPEDGVYVISVGNTEDVDGDHQTNVVFSGILKVWAETTHVHHMGLNGHTNGGHSGTGDCNCNAAQGDFEIKTNLNIRTVHMELSYPLSVEENARSKTYYSFDIN